MFDAYSVKKILPRLVIAVIGIQLSWIIFTNVIYFVSILAYGIEGLIYAPFGGVSKLTLANILATGNGTSGLFAALVGAGGLGAIGAALSLGGVVSLAFTCLLAIFIGFTMLVLRRVLIIFLLVLAPVALVAWIIPGTEKYWKLWWESFSKLLLLYPMILGVVAVGRVFAFIAVQPTNGSSGGVGAITSISQLLIVLVGVFGPFFLIPKLFTLAGSAFANLTGMVNNRSKGAFDRLRNSRQNAHKRNLEALRSGNRFKGGTPNNFRGKLNKGLHATSMINQAGINPRDMRTRMRQAMRDDSEARVGKFAQESESFNAWSGDDAKVFAAKATNHDEIGARLSKFDRGRFADYTDADGNVHDNSARREEAIAQIMRSQREVNNATFQKARVRAQSKTGTGYQDPVTGEFNAAAMLEDINDAYGDDRNGAGKALAEMRSQLANSGQVAGLAGYGTWAQQLEGMHNGTQTAQNAHNEIMDDTIKSVAPSQAMYGKPSSAAELAKAHARKIQSIAAGVAAGTHTQDDLSTAIAHAAGIADAISQASPQNGDAFVNNLFDQQILPLPSSGGNVDTGVGTVRNYIDASMGGNSQFALRRSSFYASTLNGAAQRGPVDPAQVQQQAVQVPGAGGGVPGAGGPGGGPVGPGAPS